MTRTRCLAALLPLALLVTSVSAARASSNGAPLRLVVLVVVDQLRGDEPQRYAPLWKQGMARLLAEGRWYTQAFFQHARTETAAGHATLATGLNPREHGVVDKRIYVPARGALVPVCGFGDAPCDPSVLLAPTVGDRLKAQRPAAKVVAIAQKDRAASLLGGKRADLVAWFRLDPVRLIGRGERLPQLASQLAASTAPHVTLARWMLPALPPPFVDWRDVAEGERDDGHGIRFPHVLPRKPQGALPYAWLCTPDVDRVTLALALRAIDELDLGADEATDLLLVSLAANDYIGHAFGPDSLERAAAMVALDAHLDKLLAAVERVAPGAALVALTSDHGVAPTVAEARRRGHASGRVHLEELSALIEAALAEQLGAEARVASVWPPFVSIDAPEHLRARAARIASEALAQHPAVHAAWPTDVLAERGDNPLAERLRFNAHPVRRGDVAFVLAPYYTPFDPDEGELGAEHGTPWAYDRHVPVVLWGAGVEAARIDTPVAVIDLIRTLGDRLGLAPDPRGGRPLP